MNTFFARSEERKKAAAIYSPINVERIHIYIYIYDVCVCVCHLLDTPTRPIVFSVGRRKNGTVFRLQIYFFFLCASCTRAYVSLSIFLCVCMMYIYMRYPLTQSDCRYVCISFRGAPVQPKAKKKKKCCIATDKSDKKLLQPDFHENYTFLIENNNSPS